MADLEEILADWSDDVSEDDVGNADLDISDAGSGSSSGLSDENNGAGSDSSSRSSDNDDGSDNGADSDDDSDDDDDAREHEHTHDDANPKPSVETNSEATLTQIELTTHTLTDTTGPAVTIKEVGHDLRFFGGFMCLDSDAASLSEYAHNGGMITLTSGAVRGCDVSRAKGLPVSPDCERMLCTGQQFLVQGELYCCLGLLWIGFGKFFKQRDESKSKKPKAPLLVLVVPHSCLGLPTGDMRQLVKHLSLFVAHHVLASAVFPADRIRLKDVDKMANWFANITSKYHEHPTFWRDVPRM